MIRHSKFTSESWKNLNWKKFRKDLFRLQCRVFKAIRVGDKRKALSLQKLILKSKAARFLAIRQVTQLNAGKKTAGVDGKKSLNFKERFGLEALLKSTSNNWHHQKLRSIPIPKKNGTTRMLKIPTMEERAKQYLVKLGLEPQWESKFENNSYGFRPAMSCHDAIEAIFSAIKSQSKYVLDADIEKCFDKINHKKLLAKLETYPKLKNQIEAWLKSGVIDKSWSPTDEGTPQGGVSALRGAWWYCLV